MPCPGEFLLCIVGMKVGIIKGPEYNSPSSPPGTLLLKPDQLGTGSPTVELSGSPASMIEKIAQQNFDLQEAVDEVKEEMEESLPTIHWAT